MFLYGTNAGILRSWLMAYDVVDEAMLPPFGLSAAEIEAVIMASSQDLHDWSGLATPLVQPRTGLLNALRHDLDAELAASSPMAVRLQVERRCTVCPAASTASFSRPGVPPFAAARSLRASSSTQTRSTSSTS